MQPGVGTIGEFAIGEGPADVEDSSSSRRTDQASVSAAPPPNAGAVGHGRAGEIRGNIANASTLNADAGTFEVAAEGARRDHRLQAEPGAYALDGGIINVVSAAFTAAGSSSVMADGAYAVGGPYRDAVEALWDEVRAQRVLLEATVRAYPGRSVGLGHNNGPSFLPTPNEDLSEINRFIDLLKDNGPRTQHDVENLVAAAKTAKEVAAKGETAISVFSMSVIKGAGVVIGKEVTEALLETPWWTALYARLAALATAALNWAAALLSSST